MILQSGIQHSFHFLMLGEEVGDDASAAIVDFHTGSKSFDATQNQPAFEWRENRARGLLQESELISMVPVRADHNSAQPVTMAVEELGRRVDDHICAQCERLLKIRRHKSIVDNER